MRTTTRAASRHYAITDTPSLVPVPAGCRVRVTPSVPLRIGRAVYSADQRHDLASSEVPRQGLTVATLRPGVAGTITVEVLQGDRMAKQEAMAE